ncbi:MAG: hypothetical protein M1830_005917, partial [Pleopsidium flavum]
HQFQKGSCAGYCTSTHKWRIRGSFPNEYVGRLTTGAAKPHIRGRCRHDRRRHCAQRRGSQRSSMGSM